VPSQGFLEGGVEKGRLTCFAKEGRRETRGRGRKKKGIRKCLCRSLLVREGTGFQELKGSESETIKGQPLAGKKRESEKTK